MSRVVKNMKGNNIMGETGYSLSDIAALMGDKHDGFLEGNGIIILILFFLIFGFGGGGMWGGRAGAVEAQVSTAELYSALNTQSVSNDIRAGFQNVSSGIAESRFAAENCCCTTNRNIDALRYEAAKNTCDIITNADKNTQAILNAMKDNEIQTLRDNLQSANLTLANRILANDVVNQLKPVPIPAYLTCSPYQSYASCPYSTCSCS